MYEALSLIILVQQLNYILINFTKSFFTFNTKYVLLYDVKPRNN